MRPALLAPIGPALVLALFAAAWMQGEPHAVRRWDPWLPALSAFVGVLGPSLLARGRVSGAGARAIVMAALGALLVFALLSFFVPLGAGESSGSRLYPATDAILAGALVALAALGVRPIFAVATWLAAALALARAVGVFTSSAATGVRVPEALVASLLWIGAGLLASTLALVRFIRRDPRATPR